MALVEEGHMSELAQLMEVHNPQQLAQLKEDHILQSEVHYAFVKEEVEVGHISWVLVVEEDGA